MQDPDPDQVMAYRRDLHDMAPRTVFSTLALAVREPDAIPPGFEWRVTIMRMHLILLEYHPL